MHYIDLLSYMTDVQKITKDELAELLAIPQRKIDKVTTGILPLKKKWMKNLSLYTGIPADAISSGNFILNNPQSAVAEGEEQPAIAKDAYVPERIRQENTNRLNRYCNKRYMSEKADVILLNVIQVIFTVVAIISLVTMLFAFGKFNIYDCAMLLIPGLLPVIIASTIQDATYKLAKKGTPTENKLFKFHTFLLILQLLIYAGSIFVFQWASPVLSIFAILYILPIVYLVFINNKPLFSKTNTTFFALLSIISLGIFFIATIHDEKLWAAENPEIIVLILSVGFFALETAMGCLLANYTFFTKRNHISKHFEPILKKRALKNSHKIKVIISLLLSIVLIICAIFCIPAIAFESAINAFSTTIKPGFELTEDSESKFLDYNKTNLEFTDTENCTVIENDNYTFLIPSSLQKTNDLELYKDEKNTIVVTVQDEYFKYEETFDDVFADKELKIDIKQIIKDEYGFFPKSEYEHNKLLKLISEDHISIFNKDLRIATSIFTFTDSIASGDTTVYLYNDANMEFCVREYSNIRDDGVKVTYYNVSGNAVGNYENFFNFSIIATSRMDDPSLPYRIINSIELK